MLEHGRRARARRSNWVRGGLLVAQCGLLGLSAGCGSEDQTGVPRDNGKTENGLPGSELALSIVCNDGVDPATNGQVAYHRQFGDKNATDQRQQCAPIYKEALQWCLTDFYDNVVKQPDEFYRVLDSERPGESLLRDEIAQWLNYGDFQQTKDDLAGNFQRIMENVTYVMNLYRFYTWRFVGWSAEDDPNFFDAGVKVPVGNSERGVLFNIDREPAADPAANRDGRIRTNFTQKFAQICLFGQQMHAAVERWPNAPDAQGVLDKQQKTWEQMIAQPVPWTDLSQQQLEVKLAWLRTLIAEYPEARDGIVTYLRAIIGHETLHSHQYEYNPLPYLTQLLADDPSLDRDGLIDEAALGKGDHKIVYEQHGFRLSRSFYRGNEDKLVALANLIDAWRSYDYENIDQYEHTETGEDLIDVAYDPRAKGNKADFAVDETKIVGDSATAESQSAEIYGTHGTFRWMRRWKAPSGKRDYAQIYLREDAACWDRQQKRRKRECNVYDANDPDAIFPASFQQYMFGQVRIAWHVHWLIQLGQGAVPQALQDRGANGVRGALEEIQRQGEQVMFPQLDDVLAGKGNAEEFPYMKGVAQRFPAEWDRVAVAEGLQTYADWLADWRRANP